MKISPPARRFPSAFIAVLLTAALAVAGPPARAAGAPNAADIAKIDRLLASVKPGQAVVDLGCFGMTPAQLQGVRDQLAATSDRSPQAVTPPDPAFKWPGGIVYYRFDTGTSIGAGKMQAFRDACGEWAAFAALSFVELPPPPTAPGQASFVTVQDDPSRSGGYSSAVGKAGGEQFLQIGSSAWNRGTLCHELGHALGFFHEHQRVDRDDYVTILTANIQEGAEGNFIKIPGSVTLGAYDFASVMHYGRNALGKPGPAPVDPPLDTILPTAPYIQYLNAMGSPADRTLSKLDRAGMAAVYGNPAATPGAVVTNTKDSGPGSLRTALYYAWDRSTQLPALATTISFQIPASPPAFDSTTGTFTIRPTYLLVAPGDGTTIDGATQTAFTGNTNANGPEIVLSGTEIAVGDVFASAPGLRLRGANCTVKSLAMGGFNRSGIEITGTPATGNVVSGCHLGTTALPNAFAGVEFSDGAHGNLVGGATTAARNVISGNTLDGIRIRGAGTDGNTVQGNFIGLNAAGTGALANLLGGVRIYDGAKSNTIGGTTAAARNIISGNLTQGVVFQGAGTSGNAVRGNFIGLNAAGTGALGNGFADPPNHALFSGVGIFSGASSNVIGGTAAGAGNVISGNAAQGVAIADLGSTGNRVEGNLIGLNAAGTGAIANGGGDPNPAFRYAGIDIFRAAQANIVGGTALGARNVVSGNADYGIVVTNTDTDGNLIQGNYVGTTPAGTAALGNAQGGIGIFGGAQGNTVGGTAPGAGNVISGNTEFGVYLVNEDTDGNLVQGNFIGVNAAGTAALPNKSGIGIFGSAQNNIIGGTAPGSRNVISGNSGVNSGDGVVIGNDNTNGNSVLGNTIGWNATATAAVPNTGSGVVIYGNVALNSVGDIVPGASNLIANNGGAGVAIYGYLSTTNRNPIFGNSIFDNGSSGIALFDGANDNQAAPTLTGAIFGTTGNPGGIDVTGSFASTAATARRVEFFASPGGSSFGSGRFFLGAISVPIGATSVNASLAPAVPVGYGITATATDVPGNTSAFSNPTAVTLIGGSGDSDGDGISNAWTQLYFSHSMGEAGDKSRAADDADGDGLSNLAEFRAGTHPRNSASRLTLAIDRPGADPRLTLSTVAGRTYRLEFTPSLVPTTWRLLSDQIPGTGAPLQITEPGALAFPTRFYRATIVP